MARHGHCFLEVAINVAFAAWFVRWRNSSLVFLAIIAAVIMTIFVGQTGTLNGGWAWSTFGVGVTRITFAFTVGVLLARYSIHIVATGQLVGAPADRRFGRDLFRCCL